MRKTSSRPSTPHIKPVPCNTTTTSYDVLRLILYERIGNPSPLHVESTLLLLSFTSVASGADVAALFAGLQIGHSLET